MSDDVLNRLLEEFKLSDNDIYVVSYVVENNDGDYERSFAQLRDMGFGAGLFEEEKVDEGLLEVQDLFKNAGIDHLTQSVISLAYQHMGGEVDETINWLATTGRNPEAVNVLKNGSREEIRALEEELRRQEEEKFLAEQRRIEEEIRLEKQKILDIRKELMEANAASVSIQQPTVDFSPMVQPDLIDSLNVDNMDIDYIQSELQLLAQTLNISKGDSLIDRMKMTIAQVKVKEEEKNKKIQENSKCTLSVNVGDNSIAVTFHLKEAMPPNEFDWIGMYNRDSPNKSYREYLRTLGKTSDTLMFPLPKEAGLFQFRFFPKGGYLDICRSETIYLGPELVIETAYEPGILHYTWIVTNEANVSNKDWFGLYRVGANSKNFIAADYLNLEKQSGSMPVNLKQGVYELRFFPKQCGYVHTQASTSIVVDGEDSLPLDLALDSNGRITSITSSLSIVSCPRNKSDWVGLYQQSNGNSHYLMYKYIPVEETSVTFEAPRAAGIYDLRFFSGLGTRYEDLVRSAPVTIQNTDRVTVEITEGLLKVSYDIYSQEKSSYDWIGIYNAAETNNKRYLKDYYIDVEKNYSRIPLPQQPGYYEIRYFCSNVGKYENFIKSEVFRVD